MNLSHLYTIIFSEAKFWKFSQSTLNDFLSQYSNSFWAFRLTLADFTLLFFRLERVTVLRSKKEIKWLRKWLDFDLEAFG